jgi:hypothetical protein
MAANTTTSSTGTVSGTDPNFILTYKSGNSEALYLMVKVTMGTMTSVTITLDVLNPSLHATDKYRMTALQGTDLVADTMVIKAAGNYRIPIPIIKSETVIYANITPSGAGLDGAIVANFMEA